MNALSRRLSKLETKIDQGEVIPPIFFPCAEDEGEMVASEFIGLAVCAGLEEPKIWRMENESHDQFVARAHDLHRFAVGADAMSDAVLAAAIDALHETINAEIEEKTTIPTRTETPK